MDAKLKKKWVKALRSGKYEQCKGRLHIGDGFCCLGVLCDLLDPEAWGEPIKKDGMVINGAPVNAIPWIGYSQEAYSLPPHEVCEMIGVVSTLSRLNDSGKTFEEIADYIEENY